VFQLLFLLTTQLLLNQRKDDPAAIESKLERSQFQFQLTKFVVEPVVYPVKELYHTGKDVGSFTGA